MDKMKVLFVDDDALMLKAIARSLRPMRESWNSQFAPSGAAALELMAREHFDVLVTDMRMPEMDGIALLAHVKRLYPSTARIVLSGYADQDMVLRSMTLAHQFLAKPCNDETLRTTVEKAAAQRKLVEQDKLKDVLGAIDSVPSLPQLYLELMRVLDDVDASLTKIASIVSSDLGMSSEILRIANSAFFGFGRRLETPKHAVHLLGVDLIKALALSLHVFATFDTSRLPRFRLDALWQHSMKTAGLTKQIVVAECPTDALLREHSLVAGLFHDLGKLVLAAKLPVAYAEVLRVQEAEGVTSEEAERAVLGSTHAAVGAYVIGLWGFPQAVVDAIAQHHRPVPSETRGFDLLTAVHAADALERGSESEGEAGATELLDRTYLSQIGLEERIPVWASFCSAIQEVEPSST